VNQHFGKNVEDFLRKMFVVGIAVVFRTGVTNVVPAGTKSPARTM